VLTNRYHALRNSSLGVRLAKSPIGVWLNRSPLSARVTRYTVGSIVAAATSAIVFAALYVMGMGTTACSVIAFIAGAIPNWILNRRWAWRVEGRIAFGREIVAYVIVSALTLFITAETTAWTQRHVQSIPAHHGIRVALVTASYLAVFAVLFFARFAVYEVWIFSGRSRVRAAVRSRIQVRSAARANRTP
jgi:putative flippase GtrA